MNTVATLPCDNTRCLAIKIDLHLESTLACCDIEPRDKEVRLILRRVVSVAIAMHCDITLCLAIELAIKSKLQLRINLSSL